MIAADESRYPLWELLAPPSTFGRQDYTVVGAEGTRLRFADGTQALCATSGLWNANLGYANETIAEAIAVQLREASYATLFRSSHPLAVQAARALIERCDPGTFGRIVFSTSGSAANDLAMKLVRQYHALRHEGARRVVVGLRGSYHGLTYGSFSLTGEDLGQGVYGVDQRMVRHIGFDDPSELELLLRREGDRVAAIFVEPVLGTGTRVLPDAFVAEVLRHRDRYGYLVVADEVATGFGRTGSFFGHDGWPALPDVIVMSKGLTNGTCAAAAVAVSHRICDAYDEADSVFVHAETQAGTPATCAAILATLAEFDRLDAVACGRRLGALLAGGLTRLQAAHGMISDIHGRGCFRTLSLRDGCGKPLSRGSVLDVCAEVRRAGTVVYPGPSAIQLIPALIYSDEDLACLLDSLHAALGRAGHALLRSA